MFNHAHPITTCCVFQYSCMQNFFMIMPGWISNSIKLSLVERVLAGRCRLPIPSSKDTIAETQSPENVKMSSVQTNWRQTVTWKPIPTYDSDYKSPNSIQSVFPKKRKKTNEHRAMSVRSNIAPMLGITRYSNIDKCAHIVLFCGPSRAINNC